MKKLYTNLFILALLLTSCNPDDKKAESLQPQKSASTLRSFTDTTKLDTFKLILMGDKPKNMELVFTITPEGGKPVYTKVLKAKELIDNYKEGLDLGREKKQIKFIEQELSLFFSEENFLEPAVTENQEADKNTPDRKFFTELQHSTLNGFQYRTGKESTVYIAWSAAEKKVKPYYECCKP
jgi:hypothetical protein